MPDFLLSERAAPATAGQKQKKNEENEKKTWKAFF